ncbi:conserved hypothetical protein [Theileria orientalis strain Shintoku]|uniref:Uncharacterized protein n=1 Tax=Theileria orientalis strain Shintoku TaxID=869250 RepID=J4C2Q8_THEOR|nr:conserved hypothetical protein [Theileria orientalis strain Shintoku]BAM39116.1 conserved hypothetical protein [Theileria orientalis strain Shintoku]|eukprot:XP_009689417.1 conserved hypothetical protein [Theileria orientalis strain Shintoku]
MEVTLVCDCEDCYSSLIQVGCVNILCDIPFKLLKDFSEGIAESSNCNFGRSCELYDKLNCSQIHLILITHARGFQGLNLLSECYDLSSTHIVCTRPVFVLSNIYYSTKNRKNGVRQSGRRPFYEFGSRRLISNLREPRYRRKSTEFSLLDFLNGNLLHLVSYSEPLKIDLTVSSAYTRHGPLVNALNAGRLNDFSVQLSVVATSSGYCLGSCNYLIKHEHVRERIIYVSKSSTRNRYTRPFDYSIFDDVTPEDVIIVANSVTLGTGSSTNSFSNATSTANSSDFNTGKRDDVNSGMISASSSGNASDSGMHSGNSDDEVEVKSERKRQVKEELFSDSGEPDAGKVESEEADRPLRELEKLSAYCIKAVLSGHNAIVPVDFNYEYLIDLFESLNRTIKRMKKQIYVYCLGPGVEEMFDYLEKCCDWVASARSELTMHSEDPKSPFPDLEDMKNNNQFFCSDSLAGLSSVFREPSVLVIAVKHKGDFTDYFHNENNRFLILQPKYYPPQLSVDATTVTGGYSGIVSQGSTSTPPVSVGVKGHIAKRNTSVPATSIAASGPATSIAASVPATSIAASGPATSIGASEGSSSIRKGLNGRCLCTSVNLQTSMSNINVNARVVVLSSNNRHCELHLDEVNVGYIRAGVKPKVLDKLEFISLFPQGRLKSSATIAGGPSSVAADGGSSSAPRDATIEFSKLRVDCSNIDDVAVRKTGSLAPKSTLSTPTPSTTPKKSKKSKPKNHPKSEDQVPEISDDVNDALLFGTYNYTGLLTELSKYFAEKVEVTKTPQGVTLTHSNFKISIGGDGKSTLIETVSDNYRKCILRSLQQVLISI